MPRNGFSSTEPSRNSWSSIASRTPTVPRNGLGFCKPSSILREGRVMSTFPTKTCASHCLSPSSLGPELYYVNLAALLCHFTSTIHGVGGGGGGLIRLSVTKLECKSTEFGVSCNGNQREVNRTFRPAMKHVQDSRRCACYCSYRCFRTKISKVWSELEHQNITSANRVSSSNPVANSNQEKRTDTRRES